MTSAVLDACVLYPMILRDTLLRVAAAGAFRLHWSKEILDETTRNLVADLPMSSLKAEQLRKQMETAFPDAMIEGHMGLADSMPNHPKDRHVAAAAVTADAEVIVTANLKDFEDLPQGIIAQSPDDFLCERLEENVDAVLNALERQRRAYRDPPMDLPQLLDALAPSVPRFVEAARAAYVTWKLSQPT